MILLKKRVALALALVLALCGLSGCGRKKEPFEGIPNPVATIELSDGSSMRFELFLADAPNTVANFVELANAGFYDGQKFFRIVPGVLIQAGDPWNNGTGRAEYVIQGEFAENGIENPVRHVRGTISMSRQNGYDTASTQFFILQGPYPEYNGKYAAFGQVMDEESLETLEAINRTNVDGNYSPVDAVPSIVTIKVDTFGYKYTASKMVLPETTKPPATAEEEE